MLTVGRERLQKSTRKRWTMRSCVFLGKQRQGEKWKAVDEIIVMTAMRRTGLLSMVVGLLGQGAEYFGSAVRTNSNYTGSPEEGCKPYCCLLWFLVPRAG